MDTGILIGVIGAFIAAASLLFTYLRAQRNDTGAMSSEMAEMRTKIHHNENEIGRVERSMHHTINRVEGGIQKDITTINKRIDSVDKKLDILIQRS